MTIPAHVRREIETRLSAVEAEDGARLARPDFGIVYDLKEDGTP